MVSTYSVFKCLFFEEDGSLGGGNPWAGEEGAAGEREREVADYFLNLTTKEQTQHTDRENVNKHIFLQNK